MTRSLSVCVVNPKQTVGLQPVLTLLLIFILQVFIIHEEYKVELEFTSSRVEVQNKLSQIVGYVSPFSSNLKTAN